MNKILKSGFTIIEVMLVMAIIGSLLAAIMMTIQIPINRSQYTDVVNSFQDYLKEQYTDLDNISFDATNKANAMISDCYEDLNPVKGDYGKGRSECFIVGKMIYIDTTENSPSDSESKNGTTIRAYKVFYRDVGGDNGNNFDNFFADEINQSNNDSNDKIKDNIVIGDKEETAHNLNWISDLKTPDGKFIHRKILILRSPSDGTIRTYVSDNKVNKSSNSEINDKNPANLFSMVKEEYQNKNVDFCVHPMRYPYGPIKAVRINEKTSSPSGIEIMPTDTQINRIDGKTAEAVKCQ